MAQNSKNHSWWQDLPKSELLEIRLCDLELTLAGTWLEEMVQRVYGELAHRGLAIRPHFWLSDEWFCPKGIPGVAIPFFLAHPRLIRLERQQMLEAEGASQRQCMKLLRHEVGHAVQNAYQLPRRKLWRHHFGSTTEPYPHSYLPDPFTRDYVQHLDDWYAQAHPDEDFAETFAVWLKPRSRWRRHYQDWPAIAKLEYVHDLMGDLAQQKPKIRSSRRPDAISGNRKTLAEYYQDKRSRYAVEFTDVYDRDLKRLFDGGAESPESAASFLRRCRKPLREQICRWTGEVQYSIDEMIKEMAGRCRQLKLRVAEDGERLRLDLAIMLTVHVTHQLFVRREWREL